MKIKIMWILRGAIEMLFSYVFRFNHVAIDSISSMMMMMMTVIYA